mgnify:CR=1 FL=1
MMKPSILALSIGLALSASQLAHAEVTEQDVRVAVNDVLDIRFNERVRLRQVLEHTLQAWEESAQAGDIPSLDVYWPQVRLVMLDRQAEVEQERADVLRDLQALYIYWQQRGKTEKARQVQQLAEQVQRWELGFQPYGVPDLQAARQTINQNPLLPSGDYQLILPTRPDTISVYGFSAQVGYQPVQPRQTVRNYLLGHRRANALQSLAHGTEAWRIKPAADARTIPWGLHNANDDELNPGDILYVGFDRWSLPRQFRHLEASIPQLLRHFVRDPQAQAVTLQVDGQAATPAVPAVNDWQRLDRSPTTGNYGGIGLMQMPNARFAREGEVSLSYTDMDAYRRFAVSLQVLDWMEATAFYTRIPSHPYSPFPGFSNDNIYTDKGFDVKFRIWQESEYMPQIAVGVKDIGGTGRFSAEYVVANKQFGPFDLTLGAGFGRLGTRDHFKSPFCHLADAMCERPEGFRRGGGQFEYDAWFRGPMALFAGVEYQTPWEPLRLKIEYDANDYSNDFADVDLTPRTPINFGVNYRLSRSFELFASYERGDQFTVGFNLRTNLNNLSQLKIKPDPVQPRERPTHTRVSQINWFEMDNAIMNQYSYASGRYLIDRDDNNDRVATVYTQPLRLRDQTEMLDRTARVLARDLPRSFKTYEIVEQSVFVPVVKTVIDADEFKAAINNENPDVQPHETEKLFTRVDTDNRPPWDDRRWTYGPDYRFETNYGLKPFFIQTFGSPETFHFYQLGTMAFANRWLTPKLEVFGEVGVNIANNFDRFNFTVDAYDFLPVPRVRTYVREYMLNDVWLDSLQATYFERLSRDVYAMGYAGMFERMYGGVGGELLYRPLDRPWAIGVDVNQVWQRDFSGALGFRDYNQTTGFVSLYYHMPWLHDSMLTLRAGQFLAGDKGVNVTFQRRFESGVTVGAWASFTDVSATDYGEGSFSKGFFLTIPFDLFSVIPSRQHLGFNWIPLNRDGGQMLQRRIQLHNVTEGRSPYYSR